MYEFTLNVSKGSVHATDIYGRFRSDVTAVKVEVGYNIASVQLQPCVLDRFSSKKQ